MLESELQNDLHVWHEKYKDEDAIYPAIQMVNNRVKELTGAVADKSASEKMRYFNDWLTTHNEYNYYVGIDGADVNAVLATLPDTFECTSALQGSTGYDGPVCEAYARSFKVLCEASGIPCVLVDGFAFNGSANENHMWNYAQAEDGKWYAVDVTWNDPLAGANGAISGYENETYFLIGADTMTYVGYSEMKFIQSHPETNQIYPDGNMYINGPVLSKDAFVEGGTPEPTPEA